MNIAFLLLILSALTFGVLYAVERRGHAETRSALAASLKDVRRYTHRYGRMRGVAERANMRAADLERSVLDMEAEVARLTDEASRSLPAAPWRTASPEPLDEKAETFATTGPQS